MQGTCTKQTTLVFALNFLWRDWPRFTEKNIKVVSLLFTIILGIDQTLMRSAIS